MIVDFFLGLFTSLINAAASALPDPMSLPSVDFASISGPLGQIDWLVPIYPVFAVVLAVLLMGPAFATVSLGMWIVAFIRGAEPRL